MAAIVPAGRPSRPYAPPMVNPTGREEGRDAPHTFRGLTLFPFQRRSVQAISAGKNVVVAAPTGAGKTLVADYAIEQALEARSGGWSTPSPIKALSNQKFRDFREHYGEEQGRHHDRRRHDPARTRRC